MDIEISFEEPPAIERPGGFNRGSKWDPIVEQLEANRGQWAKITTFENASKANSASSTMRSRGLLTSTRTDKESGQVTLWAVAPDDAQAAEAAAKADERAARKAAKAAKAEDEEFDAEVEEVAPAEEIVAEDGDDFDFE